MAEKISSAVIRRLPRYYRYIDELYAKGVTRVSSKILAEDLGLTASQVRQDFSCFGGFGQQGYGYHVESLRTQLGEILGLHSGYKSILIGVGNLGLALLNNFNFEDTGFCVTAAFDLDPKKVGTTVNGINVYHMNDLEEYCKREEPILAVLTVPRSAAAEAADRLINLGIRGFWNFTNVDFSLSDKSIILENVHLSDSLMTLSYRLNG